MSRSFKQGGGSRPHNYRTPSPPLDAVELNSPSTLNHKENEQAKSGWASYTGAHTDLEQQGYTRNLQSIADQESHGISPITMDSLASIALSNSADPSQRHQIHHELQQFKHYGVSQRDYADRPTKRARSEKLPSRQGPRARSRPTTSHARNFDVMTSDAELLLGISIARRFSPSRKKFRQHSFEKTIHPQTSLHEISADPLYVPLALKEPGPAIELYSESNPLMDAQQIGPSSPKPYHGGTIDEFPGTVSTESHDSLPASILRKPMPYNLETNATADQSQPETTSAQTSNRVYGWTSQHDEAPEDETERPRAILSPEYSDTLIHARTDTCQAHDINILALRPINMPKNTINSAEQSSFGEAEPRNSHQSQPSRPTSAVLRTTVEQQATQRLGSGSDDCHIPLDPSPALRDNGYYETVTNSVLETNQQKLRQSHMQAICAACNFTRNTLNTENENDATSWISCDGCKAWFHFACAGFKNEREVRGVDKYRCRKCKPSHGPTTYVRKSSRAHTAIDYAGLNEGVVKASDENPEHHYIKPIKDGTITFQPETFPRMRPELVTAEFFEKNNGMKEPVVIPACLNPRPKPETDIKDRGKDHLDDRQQDSATLEKSVLEEWFSRDYELEEVPDQGQDALDMVIPQNLTVRRVAELYGPEEKVEVIDVKSQNGEDKKWNMRRWADYYESRGNKIVRNVISLEVSQSKLGRLIRRPRIVRDLDLQDAVWPADLQARGDFPKVQFYCLMSVADCFTDFHIDFGGSSVFYHILKGKKTFLFIPPKEKHLKKYEEWCMSPAQNWTFLADQTKECYRVDLSEGDTMLIPAGWIHAVWTPEDSLVIGGNFLTRMHYPMQIRIAQIEKVTGVARKFRYPHFQKILWYTAIDYMEQDPLPQSVLQAFETGSCFNRERPTHYDFEGLGNEVEPATDNYHARYYSQAELDGLPDLVRYLLRTALIVIGSITEGVTAETRNAVKRSIPKGHGEPLDLIKKFAMWCAWKRGNEPIPHWAYADAVPEGGAPESAEKRLSAAAIKRLDREAALQAYRVAPERQSARKQLQKQNVVSDIVPSFSADEKPSHVISAPAAATTVIKRSHKKKVPVATADPTAIGLADSLKKKRVTPGHKNLTPRKPACEVCRKRRRACKHKDEPDQPSTTFSNSTLAKSSVNVTNALPEHFVANGTSEVGMVSQITSPTYGNRFWSNPRMVLLNDSMPASHLNLGSPLENDPSSKRRSQTMSHVEINKGQPTILISHGSEERSRFSPHGLSTNPNSSHSRRVRNKACSECRKSKRRCVHDEYGNEEPIKLREAAISRPAATLKRPRTIGEEQGGKTPKSARTSYDMMLHDLGTKMNMSAPNAASTEATSGSKDQAPDPSHAEDSEFTITLDKPTDVDRTQVGLHNQFETPTTPLRVQHSHPNEPSASCLVSMPRTDLENAESPEDEVLLVATSPQDLKVEFEVRRPPMDSSTDFQQDNGASFISPPASSHTDAEKTPPAIEINMTPLVRSLQRSPRPQKQILRYTPESGPTRRASSAASSVLTEKSTSPTLEDSIGEEIRYSVSRQSKTRKTSEISADEESLRLIKQLQAEEYGLRRRGRA